MAIKLSFETVPIVEIMRKGIVADDGQHRPVVLVVDDEEIIADTRTTILNNWGYAAMTAYSAEAALELAEVIPPDVLVSDVILTGMNGVELAVAILAVVPDCKIILISGLPSSADMLAAVPDAWQRFTLLEKPLHPNQLLVQLSKLDLAPPCPKAALEAVAI
jgi:DNA-binding NtrC family response regulator